VGTALSKVALGYFSMHFMESRNYSFMIMVHNNNGVPQVTGTPGQVQMPTEYVDRATAMHGMRSSTSRGACQHSGQASAIERKDAPHEPQVIG
jgi:hypothetical protein